MRSEKVTFPGAGGIPLAGRLDLPDSQIAIALTGFDIAVLRFDFTGLGGSGGDFANTSFTRHPSPVARRTKVRVASSRGIEIGTARPGPT